jgi:hypothetical protein
MPSKLKVDETLPGEIAEKHHDPDSQGQHQNPRPRMPVEE